ncbi:MAG TPA: substrate-binding domain-containing protein [Spirochaetota bacterium]|nr:substrate-binding domain-containing protein [Spirochaetota bacterium]HPS85493.1 substrate-binding domain-containing protein [Spirochaetota bacterium]
MPAENMSTKETAEYLGINEKQVYALIKSKSIPCTRVTGKWVFPKKLIDRWITTNALKNGPYIDEVLKDTTGALFAAGSNDPILDILINRMQNGTGGKHIFSCVTGSTEGIRLLGCGFTDIAWCHLSKPGTGEYDMNAIADLVPDKKIAIVHLFQRELGFLLPLKTGSEKMSFAKIAGDGIEFINRQKGSGTRILTEHFLDMEGIDSGSIKGYDNEVNTHMEVGLKILSGKAGAGAATGSVAKILGLKFQPLINESFDMVLVQETFFREEVQKFIETLQSEEFREMVAPLGNYDFAKSGKIIYTTG